MDEITEGCNSLHNEELQDVYATTDLLEQPNQEKWTVQGM
jgi:hypothetical protein